jgi:hypothetical protein
MRVSGRRFWMTMAVGKDVHLVLLPCAAIPRANVYVVTIILGGYLLFICVIATLHPLTAEILVYRSLFHESIWTMVNQKFLYTPLSWKSRQRQFLTSTLSM